ncbi:hypothetical protein ENHY17A_210091 [Moraxellaceae bacterium 17A]|nr:hypothetical protein ENHY17A_210091 [Moraxellaceae bacterium 17A]
MFLSPIIKIILKIIYKIVNGTQITFLVQWLIYIRGISIFWL